MENFNFEDLKFALLMYCIFLVSLDFDEKRRVIRRKTENLVHSLVLSCHGEQTM